MALDEGLGTAARGRGLPALGERVDAQDLCFETQLAARKSARISVEPRERRARVAGAQRRANAIERAQLGGERSRRSGPRLETGRAQGSQGDRARFDDWH